MGETNNETSEKMKMTIPGTSRIGQAFAVAATNVVLGSNSKNEISEAYSMGPTVPRPTDSGVGDALACLGLQA